MSFREWKCHTRLFPWKTTCRIPFPVISF